MSTERQKKLHKLKTIEPHITWLYYVNNTFVKSAVLRKSNNKNKQNNQEQMLFMLLKMCMYISFHILWNIYIIYTYTYIYIYTYYIYIHRHIRIHIHIYRCCFYLAKICIYAKISRIHIPLANPVRLTPTVEKCKKGNKSSWLKPKLLSMLQCIILRIHVLCTNTIPLANLVRLTPTV